MLARRCLRMLLGARRPCWRPSMPCEVARPVPVAVTPHILIARTLHPFNLTAAGSSSRAELISRVGDAVGRLARHLRLAALIITLIAAPPR